MKLFFIFIALSVFADDRTLYTNLMQFELRSANPAAAPTGFISLFFDGIFKHIDSLGNVTTIGGGNVSGPAAVIDSNLAAFDTATGKLIKDSLISLNNVPEMPVVGGIGMLLQTAAPDKIISSAGIAVADVPTMSAAGGAGMLLQTAAADKAISSSGIPVASIATMSSTGGVGMLLQTVAANKVISSAGIPVADVPTMTAAGTAGTLLQTAASDKVISSAGIAITDIPIMSVSGAAGMLLQTAASDKVISSAGIPVVNVATMSVAGTAGMLLQTAASNRVISSAGILVTDIPTMPTVGNAGTLVQTADANKTLSSSIPVANVVTRATNFSGANKVVLALNDTTKELAETTYTFPSTDGLANSVLKTDGSGVVAWAADITGTGDVVGPTPAEIATTTTGKFPPFLTQQVQYGYEVTNEPAGLTGFQVFDGNINQDFYGPTSPVSVTLKTPNPTALNSYKVWLAGDASRNWTISGSTDNTNWTVLSTVVNASPTDTWYVVTLGAPSAQYSYFKMHNLSGGYGAGDIYELEYNGTAQTTLTDKLAGFADETGKKLKSINFDYTNVVTQNGVPVAGNLPKYADTTGKVLADSQIISDHVVTAPGAYGGVNKIVVSGYNREIAGSAASIFDTGTELQLNLGGSGKASTINLDGTSGTKGRISFWDDAYKITLQAPTTLIANYDLIWPVTGPPADNQILKTGVGSSGQLYWANMPGGTTPTCTGAQRVTANGTTYSCASNTYSTLTTAPTIDVNWAASHIYYATVTANTTFTFSNSVDGMSIQLAVYNSNASDIVATLPAAKWADGSIVNTVYATSLTIFSITKIAGLFYVTTVDNMK